MRHSSRRRLGKNAPTTPYSARGTGARALFDALEPRVLFASYVLNGGTASMANGSYDSSVDDTSGVAVYGGGNLTLTTPTVATTNNATDQTNADLYGTGAAVLAGNNTTTGILHITSGTITSTGQGANGLFATHTGSAATMTNGSIATSGLDAHGVAATYAAQLMLSGVTVGTSGLYSPAVDADYGGIVNMSGGSGTASGTDGPAVSVNVDTELAQTVASTVAITNSTLISQRYYGALIGNGGVLDLTGTSLTAADDGVVMYSPTGAGLAETLQVNGGALAGTSGNAVYIQGVTAHVLLENGASVTDAHIVDGDATSNVTFVADGETLSGSLIVATGGTLNATLQNATSLVGGITNGTTFLVSLDSIWDASATSSAGALTVNGTLNPTAAVTASSLTVGANATLGISSTGSIAVAGNVRLGSNLTINTNGLTAGTYPLLTYTGTLTGMPAVTFTGLAAGQAATLSTTTAGEVTVTITGNAVVRPAPTLVASPLTLTLTPAVRGTAGAATTFTVRGANLTLGTPVTVTALAGTEISTDNVTYARTVTLNASSTGVLNSTLHIRIAATATANVSGTISVVDVANSLIRSIAVTGTSTNGGTAGLVVSATALTLPTTVEGTTGATATFTVTGTNLSASSNLFVTAPTGVELSLDNVTYLTTLTFAADRNGALAATTIYARTTAAATANIAGTILVAEGTDSLTRTVTVAGTVTALPVTPVPVTTTVTSTISRAAGGAYSFTDADGSAVTVTLASRTGTAVVTRSTTDGVMGNITGITLAGTDARSTLTITATGGADGLTSIGGITDPSALGTINATGVTLTGPLNVGGLNTLRLGAAADTSVTVGAAGAARVNLNFGSVTGSDIVTAVPVGTFRAQSVVAGTVGSSALSAPSINTVSVTGGFAGNMTAATIRSITVGGNLADGTINVTGSSRTRTALGHLSVGGAVSNSTVLVTGNVGSVIANTMLASTLNLAGANVTVANATTATLGGSTLSSFRLTSTAGGAFSDSSLIAGHIGTALLAAVNTSNGGVVFGVATTSARSLTGTANAIPFNLGPTSATTVTGDFDIELV